MKGNRGACRLCVLSILGAVLLITFPTPVRAHWADLAVAEIVVEESTTRLTLTFPTGLVARVDDDRDGQLSPEEVRAHRTELQAFMGERIRLNDGRLDGTLKVEPSQTPVLRQNLKVTPGTHTTLLLIYSWRGPIQELTIHYGLFLPGVPTASALATILQGGRVQSYVFTPENRQLSFSLGRGALWQQGWSFLLLGIRHILTGYDHVLFLLSLLMLGGGLGGLLKIVTAFTVAHSVTLSLAVLDIVTLPPRVVESGVALSIAYVAAENLWRRDKDKALRMRWKVTFGFGLIHGLGFASILKEMAIPRSSLALSLVSFNAGVEVGQVAIVATAFLCLLALRKLPWELTFRRLVSAGAVAVGLIWFVQRAFLTF